MQNQQSYKYTLPSDHTLMTSFMHFNQKRDKFITCGEEGQINVYSLTEKQGISKIAYANLFDQVVVCVKWGTPTSGGYVAVGGSKGSLLILSIDYFSGVVVVHKHFNFGVQNIPHSVDWHPEKPLLLMGTINGLCYTISLLYYSQWTYSRHPYQLYPHQIRGEVVVSFGIPGSNSQFAGFEEFLYYLVPYEDQNRVSETQRVQELARYQDQKILALMPRTECPEKYFQLYVLSTSKLRVYRVIPSESEDKLVPQLNQIQELNVEEYGCDQMSWGWSQSEVILSSTTISNREKLAKNENYVKTPIVLKRKLNGKLLPA